MADRGTDDPRLLGVAEATEARLAGPLCLPIATWALLIRLAPIVQDTQVSASSTEAAAALLSFVKTGVVFLQGVHLPEEDSHGRDDHLTLPHSREAG